MGDEQVIRYSLFILSCCITLLQADLSASQVDQMIEKITKQRAGVDLKTLEQTKEPFFGHQAEHNTTHDTIPDKDEVINFALHSILNGKAYIDNTWMNEGDIIMGYTLKYIGKSGVILKKR